MLQLVLKLKSLLQSYVVGIVFTLPSLHSFFLCTAQFLAIKLQKIEIFLSR